MPCVGFLPRARTAANWRVRPGSSFWFRRSPGIGTELRRPRVRGSEHTWLEKGEDKALRRLSNRLLWISMLLFGMVSIPAAVEAQVPAALEGRVVDAVSGGPVAQALVIAIGEAGDTLFQSQTSSLGAFFVPPQPPTARFRIVVDALGFNRQAADYIAGDDGPGYWTIRLDPQPVSAEGFIVEVEQQTMALRRVGFYDRRERTRGVFIDQTEFEKSTAPTLGDMLRRASGVSVTPQGEPFSSRTLGNFNAMGQDASASGACLPAVYVDDVLVRKGALPASWERNQQSLEVLAPPPSQLEGMEFYHSTSSVPPAYAGIEARCGVLVLWTRRWSQRWFTRSR